MNKIKNILFILSLIILMPVFAFGAFTLPWATTFNCAEYNMALPSYSYPMNCDGIGRGGDNTYAIPSKPAWATSIQYQQNALVTHGSYLYICTLAHTSGTASEPGVGGSWTTYWSIAGDFSGGTTYVWEQITSAANYSSGGGGRGQRHWMADGNNGGTAPMSGGMIWTISNPSTNIWIRFYFRVQSGVAINTIKYWKIFYVFRTFGDTTNSFYVDTEAGGIDISLYDRTSRWTSTYGFDDVYPGGISDGSWHAVEFHFNTATGVFEYWFYVGGIDNSIPKYSTSSATYRSGLVSSGIGRIEFPSNHKANDGTLISEPIYLDVDDIVISNTGRIGPILVQTVSPPNNLRIVE